MNMHVSPTALSAAAETAAPDPQAIAEAVAGAAKRVAPLWPLERFVAVNPFLGLASMSAPEAAQVLARVGGARLTMPISFYRDALAKGIIGDEDLLAALTACRALDGLPGSVSAFKSAIAAAGDGIGAAIPSVAHTAQKISGQDWPAFVTDRISHWASHHFDKGQSVWRTTAEESFAAWRTEASLDMTPEIMGLKRFRQAIAALPESADAAIAACVAALGLRHGDLTDYFHSLLFGLGGWASYARFLGWEKELSGESDGTLKALLAVRLAWDYGLAEALAARSVTAAWRKDFVAAMDATPNGTPDLNIAVVAHMAYELARQREFLARLNPGATASKPETVTRAQAVFCIDVRSEVFRRALEKTSAHIETLGFAGFFGAPIAFAPLGAEKAKAHVPVLLKPAFTVTEEAKDSARPTLKLAEDAVLAKKTGRTWKSFQQSAVSSFAFVETIGPGFGLKLIGDALGLRKTSKAKDDVKPSIAAIAPETRLAMAEGALRGMSLTRNLAPLVLLVGHGSASLNNPHASGLDCGACGGHTGEASARVMAQVLNDSGVRAGLSEKGIDIPAGTVFLGALHNTTTDVITIFDAEDLPAAAKAELQWFEARCAEAGETARAERAQRITLAGKAVAVGTVKARAEDWSQVRPEWGLAGCAGFIAAPRRFTKGSDFGGRAFLHSYEWKQDYGFKVLELIMTAPVVVASWISLQYFGSTVDNRHFGSGNKVLHNVVGGSA